jgi:hypothetical protein
MGWIPAKIFLYLEMFRFWNRVIALPQHRLTKKIFNWDFDCCHQNWSSDIYELFSDCECLDTFISKGTCDINNIQMCLMNTEVSNWDVARHSKDKLRTYNMFKWNYESEEYVQKNFNRKMRSLIAQFRSGILPLQIEVGRFRNIPVENRVCFSCPDKIEDEFHL